MGGYAKRRNWQILVTNGFDSDEICKMAKCAAWLATLKV